MFSFGCSSKKKKNIQQRPPLKTVQAKREASQLERESKEAMQMMTEMRKAHLQEVRLLQRGLQARGNGEMRCGRRWFGGFLKGKNIKKRRSRMVST